MRKSTKIALIIVCLFVAICSTAIIVVFNFSSKQVANADFVPSKDAERFISDDLYSAKTDKSHIKVNQKTGLEYIDNEIILFAENDSTEEDITSLVNDKNGYIVGRAKEAYQIRFTEFYDYGDLDNLKNDFESSPLVDICFVNIPMAETSGDSYFPAEKGNIWKDDWNASLPDGDNWGIEAIKAPEAWEYIDLMAEVKVGVFDMGFDKEHEDLKDNIASTSLDSKNKKTDHGTHVAGTIGAGFNNGKGVDGVFPKSKFSFIDVSSASKDETQFFFVTAMKYLIEEQKCKSINVSLGFSDETLIYGASQGNERALEYINECTGIAEECLNNSLEKNCDFVICQSAGNTNNKQFKENKNKEYGYEIVASGGENKGCDARYSCFFTAIDDEEVRKHIIVVSAVQNDTTDLSDYKVCDFSNVGERVDVLAPGKDIESSVPDNKYGKKSGTSMATPHVAGIAAMLYSLDSDIKEDKVKEIICDTASKREDGNKFVDAEAAVNKVLGNGKITIRVVESDDDTPINDVKVSASIKLKSGNKQKKFSYTDNSGNLTMELPCGEYEIKLEKDGYRGKSIDVKIEKDTTDLTYSHKPIAMEKENNSVATDEEKNTNANDTAKEKNIDGTWVSVDKKYVFTFKVQEGSLGIDYNSGLSVASGVFNYVNINNGNDRINGSFNYTDINTIVATVNLSDGKSITFSFENDRLVSDNIVLEKIPNEVITQFEGTWQNSDEEITFDSDGEYKYKKDNYSTWGYYYVLSESNIILSNKSHDFKTYSYSIVDTQISFSNGIIFNRITSGADADTLLSLKDIIVGTWEYSDFNEEYRIYNDGTWERYIVSYHGNQSEPMSESFLEGGTYKILNESQVELDKGFAFNILAYNKVTGALSGDGIVLTKKS